MRIVLALVGWLALAMAVLSGYTFYNAKTQGITAEESNVLMLLLIVCLVSGLTLLGLSAIIARLDKRRT